MSNATNQVPDILTLYYISSVQRSCFYHSLCLCKGRLMSRYVSRCYIVHTHTQTVTLYSILTLYYMGHISFIQRRCSYNSLCLCTARLMSRYVSKLYIVQCIQTDRQYILQIKFRAFYYMHHISFKQHLCYYSSL